MQLSQFCSDIFCYRLEMYSNPCRQSFTLSTSGQGSRQHTADFLYFPLIVTQLTLREITWWHRRPPRWWLLAMKMTGTGIARGHTSPYRPNWPDLLCFSTRHSAVQLPLFNKKNYKIDFDRNMVGNGNRQRQIYEAIRLSVIEVLILFFRRIKIKYITS